MEVLAIPILTGSAAGCFAYGCARIAIHVKSNDRQRMHERLSGGFRRKTEERRDASVLISQEHDEGIWALLGKVNILKEVRSAVIQAYPELGVNRFLQIVLGTGLVGLVLVLLLTGSFVVASVGAMLAGSLPFFMVIRRRNSRQRQLADQLPDALDFLARALRAGHSFTTALQMLAEEMPAPLSKEFQRAFERHSLGEKIDDVLREMTERIEATDFKFFVTAVLVQRQTGGDLAEVLDNIGGMIRQRIRLEQHVKSKTAEGRFTGYILAAFPLVMFVLFQVLNPEYAGKLVHTSAGLKMLGTSVALVLMGLYTIRKITRVRI